MSIIIFSTVFYAVYAYFREQVCTVVCPYGRLQSVLLDRNSMIVAYDYKRGEPRGKYSKMVDSGLGDCIDCFQCVKVCPTAIDIRNGTQMECVGCTACIDACNHMMEKTGKTEGLDPLCIGKWHCKQGNVALYNQDETVHRITMRTGWILSHTTNNQERCRCNHHAHTGMLFQERGGEDSLQFVQYQNSKQNNPGDTPDFENGRMAMVNRHHRWQINKVKKEDESSGNFFGGPPKKYDTKKKNSY